MIKFQHVIIVFNLFRVFRVVSVVNTLGLVLKNRGRQGSHEKTTFRNHRNNKKTSDRNRSKH